MFTQKCYIKNSSLELRKKLEKLGYEFTPRQIIVGNQKIDLYDKDREDAYIVTGAKHYWIALDEESLPLPYMKYLDCGENEELFLALAALSDHTDRNQWYICQEEFISTNTLDFVRKGTWQKSAISYMSYGQKKLWRKATVAELIERFVEEDLKVKIEDIDKLINTARSNKVVDILKEYKKQKNK